ncbi:MAG: CPBP family intramembrane glutamic endopeptidase [Planctomycetota bacterium]
MRREPDPAAAGRPSAAAVATTTVATFLLVEFGRPYLQAMLGIPTGPYHGLADLVLRHYTWYWLPPVAVAWALFGRRRTVNALGLDRSPLLGLGVAGLCTLPMLVGFAALGQASPGAQPWSDAVRYALLPGCMEEILFRGMLFGFLFRFAGWGFLPAAMLGAAFFGAGHLWQGHSAGEAAGVFAVTALGAVWFAWLYVEWRANLWVPIGFHVLMNLWWDRFAMGESALGGGVANVFRTATIGLSVWLTLARARRHGGLVVRGRRWLRG